MHLLYVLTSYALFALLLPVLIFSKKTRGGLRQRFGFFNPGDLPPSKPAGRTLWLHGASAGDLLSLSPMIARLRKSFPESRIILSTITNTGYLMAKERLASQVDAVIYAPFDLWGATRRAIRAIAPDLLVLEYTEIWPNLIHAARRFGTRIALTNGRISPKHSAKYQALFALIGNPLKKIDLFLMREQEEADRILALGAPRDRVRVTGNTKFDALMSPPAVDEAATVRTRFGFPADADVFIAGSTHEGEEESLLRVYSGLLKAHPNLRMLIAPRYIDRAKRIRTLVEEAGLEATLRSETATTPEDPNVKKVVVLDTIGELASAYRMATLVFVGGSFTTRGGQNILEPAAQGRPVLFGPHMENFHDSVQVLVGRGGIQVKDAEHLYRVMADLLSRPDKVAALGALAHGTVRQISGASQRNVEQMQRVL